MRRLILAVITTVLLAGLAGCGPTRVPRAADSGLAGSSVATPSGATTGSPDGLEPPSYRELDDGTSQVVGMLAYNAEKGAFAVVNAVPGTPLSGNEQILAVIVRPDGRHASELDGMVGAYVSFTGSKLQTTITPIPAPEIAPVNFRILQQPKK